MHRDSDRHKLFNRRAFMLGGGKLLLISPLVARMYYLQVIEAEKYKMLADENRISLRLLAPPRGQITDRFGRMIAENQQNYRALLVPEESPDISETLDIISEIIPINAAEKQRILRETHSSRKFVPMTLRENLGWNEVARIEVNAPDLPGIMIDVGQSRYYPEGEKIAHVLGYVATPSKQDINGDPLLELPGFRIGKAGIEKTLDIKLRGKGGSFQVEVNAFGRVIRELKRQEGQPGEQIALTIDMGLQKFIADRLGDESASVVVMDVHTGDILALSSTPSFDPNAFSRGLTSDEWKVLAGNKKKPLINKAIAGQYSPGSTFKMSNMLAALDKGVVKPEEKIFCSGSITVGDSTFHCWKKNGHGLVNAEQAIEQSCDVYFYEIAMRTGIERMSAMAKRLGMGANLGIELSGERPGLMPDKQWKRKTLGKSWLKGETIIAGIGQGFVQTTPLQLAVMTARLSNGGFAVTPRLTRTQSTSKDDTADVETGNTFPSINISPADLKLVLNAMNRVVNSPRGTARRSEIKDPNFRMAGKTGTVQVRRITKSEREQGVIKNKNLPWERRDHALFVAFAPVDAPRYAVSVVVEHGGGGSSVAAPIARDVIIEAGRRQSVKPGVLDPQISQPITTSMDQETTTEDQISKTEKQTRKNKSPMT